LAWQGPNRWAAAVRPSLAFCAAAFPVSVSEATRCLSRGRTVLKGTKIEPFDVEVLGVLKNTSPGCDMVLCRLSGLGLEKTGVIAGMSGSPVYINGKCLAPSPTPSHTAVSRSPASPSFAEWH
jgi:hypothetical protein